MSTGVQPVALDLLADLEPVHARQHQVEHDEVGMMIGVLLDRVWPVQGHEHAVALGLEAGTDGLGDGFLVVDDEHGLLGHRAIVVVGCVLRSEAVLRNRGGGSGATDPAGGGSPLREV